MHPTASLKWDQCFPNLFGVRKRNTCEKKKNTCKVTGPKHASVVGKLRPRGERAGRLPVCLGDTWRMTFCILLNQLPSFGLCRRQHPEPLESALATVDQRRQELSRHQTNMNPEDRNCRTETRNRARQHLPLIYLFFNAVQMWTFVSATKWVTLIDSGTGEMGKQKQLHKRTL